MYQVQTHIGTKTTVTYEVARKQDALDLAAVHAECMGLSLWKGRVGHWTEISPGPSYPSRDVIVYNDGVPVDYKY